MLPGTVVCEGGPLDPCPCGNQAEAGSGCANSSGSGATLAGFGQVAVAADDHVLRVVGLPPNQAGVFLQGAVGPAVPFRDGLLCMTPPTVRLEAVQADEHREPDAACDQGGVHRPHGKAAEHAGDRPQDPAARVDQEHRDHLNARDDAQRGRPLAGLPQQHLLDRVVRLELRRQVAPAALTKLRATLIASLALWTDDHICAMVAQAAPTAAPPMPPKALQTSAGQQWGGKTPVFANSFCDTC